jgi:hypothetical protein
MDTSHATIVPWSSSEQTTAVRTSNACFDKTHIDCSFLVFDRSGKQTKRAFDQLFHFEFHLISVVDSDSAANAFAFKLFRSTAAEPLSKLKNVSLCKGEPVSHQLQLNIN